MSSFFIVYYFQTKSVLCKYVALVSQSKTAGKWLNVCHFPAARMKLRKLKKRPSDCVIVQIRNVYNQLAAQQPAINSYRRFTFGLMLLTCCSRRVGRRPSRCGAGWARPGHSHLDQYHSDWGPGASVAPWPSTTASLPGTPSRYLVGRSRSTRLCVIKWLKH